MYYMSNEQVSTASQNHKVVYVDPTVQDYIEYSDHLRAYNEKVHRTI